jgi:hypothetical protein
MEKTLTISYKEYQDLLDTVGRQKEFINNLEKYVDLKTTVIIDRREFVAIPTGTYSTARFNLPKITTDEDVLNFLKLDLDRTYNNFEQFKSEYKNKADVPLNEQKTLEILEVKLKKSWLLRTIFKYV